MTTTQLNPEKPFYHPESGQLCYAFAMLDYSQDHDLMFAVTRQDGQIWVYSQKDLRAVDNETLGRKHSTNTGPLHGFSFAAETPAKI